MRCERLRRAIGPIRPFLAMVPVMPIFPVMLVVASAIGCGSDAADSTAPAAPAAPTEAVVPGTPAPVMTSAPTVPSAPSASADPVRVAYGPAPENFGELYLPSAEAGTAGHPVVVLIHGGFWREQFDLTLMDPLARDLVERGYAAWNIEYRRVGGAGGWPETGEDVAAAIDALVEIAADHPLDLGRVMSVGHSAGGHLGLWALENANRVSVGRAIGLGAVVDLAYFPESVGLLGGTSDEVPEVYADAAPVLDADRVVLIQGAADRIVPTASLQPAVEAGVTVIEIEGEDHFDLIDPASESWAAALDVLDAAIGS